MACELVEDKGKTKLIKWLSDRGYFNSEVTLLAFVTNVDFLGPLTCDHTSQVFIDGVNVATLKPDIYAV